MTDGLTWSVSDDEIDWSFMSDYEKGKKLDAPREIVEFEEEKALALMLINDVIFINSHWWEEEWPERARGTISLNVNCNDVFAWGCSDAEALPHAEIENLYRAWRKDPHWGAAIWCMLQRKQMPQKPVEAAIRKAGVWDLDSLNLNKNTMDAEISQWFRQNAGAIKAAIAAKENGKQS